MIFFLAVVTSMTFSGNFAWAETTNNNSYWDNTLQPVKPSNPPSVAVRRTPTPATRPPSVAEPEPQPRVSTRSMPQTNSGGNAFATCMEEAVNKCAENVGYGLGGRPSIDGNIVRLGRTVDCTGLPSAALAMCGLKATHNWFAFSTSSISTAACFERKQPARAFLSPGDIVVTGGHAVIVTQATQPNCNRVNLENSGLTVAESSGSKSGPSIHKASQIGHRGIKSLIQKAIRAHCAGAGSVPGIFRHKGRVNGCTANPKELRC